MERYTQAAALTYAAAAVPAQALATTPVDQPTAQSQPAAPQAPAIADVDRESSWEVVAFADAQSEEDGLAGVAFAEVVADVVAKAPTRQAWSDTSGRRGAVGPMASANSLDCRRSPEPRRCQRCFPVVALDAAEVVG